MSVKTDLPNRMPATFDELMALHALRPIADEVDLANATDVLDRLAVVGAPTADQADYLRTLTLLVEEYEAVNHPVDRTPVAPLAKLRFLVDAHGMTGEELARLLGVGPPLASMILSGQRAITVEHARKLGERFGVVAAAFLDV